MVTSSLKLNPEDRTTVVRLGMSKHHLRVDENHFQELCDEDTRMFDSHL